MKGFAEEYKAFIFITDMPLHIYMIIWILFSFVVVYWEHSKKGRVAS